MHAPLPGIRKRLPRGDDKRSACWVLKDLPSMLLMRSEQGGWVAVYDRTWLLAGERRLPDHVHLAMKMEDKLQQDYFATRKELLAAIQALLLWDEHNIKAVSTASSAS